MFSTFDLQPTSHYYDNSHEMKASELASAQKSRTDIHPQNTYDTSDLQAGRKRRESELDGSNDSGDGAGRRRISRACDQCNQLRTKCDGRQPCVHCTENGLRCDYVRVRKKRGRIARTNSGHPTDTTTAHIEPTILDIGRNTAARRTHSQNTYTSPNEPTTQHLTAPTSNDVTTGFQNSFFNDYESSLNVNHAPLAQNHDNMMSDLSQQPFAVPTGSEYLDVGLDGYQLNLQHGFGFSIGNDQSVAFMGRAPVVESLDWGELNTPVSVIQPVLTHQHNSSDIRLPVLLPLMSHIENIMPYNVACDLIEQYFASSTSAYLRPSNPYIHGFIFRKKSFLDTSNPRPCSPALLASMLWIVAQTSDAPFLTNQLDTRAKICQKLLELIMNLLEPLVHHPSKTMNGSGAYGSDSWTDARSGRSVVPWEQTSENNFERMQVDTLATYIHLATVVSASERKAQSLYLWGRAWNKARELRLGRELPSNEARPESCTDQSPGDQQMLNRERGPKMPSISGAPHEESDRPTGISEEEREERRRTWWLLYMQDRHLALCYNRPTIFLNTECLDLLQPLDDELWQAGRFDLIDHTRRKRGLNIECTSHSVFGYFLPLMVILGEILDFNHARNRPRFGPRSNIPRNWDETIHEITQQLEMYEESLRRFENVALHDGDHSHDSPMASKDKHTVSELNLRTRTVVAYGTHISHVLHILLTSKWDPIALLDDTDFLNSPQSFVTATGHAVNAAEAVADVIEYDPDLSFMPYFFGIYLLQGSFLLLLFADKLRGDVSADVVKACETIVRAHEACVATLDTQYQRNFRKVMRSALQQVRGRISEDPTEQQKWRREVLKLYRWTGDGTGLAL